MNTNDVLNTWSTLSLDEIAARLASGEDVPVAQQIFGPEETAGMVVAAPRAAQRAAGPREPVVLLPGIMGSLLASIRGITTLMWLNPAIFLNGQANYLDLSVNGTSDADPAIETVPLGLEKLCYLKPALTLRRETELFEFPYDWRRPIEYNADVLDQTLERWAAGSDKKFTLVGHSMGGLVARAYLVRHPQAAAKRIKRLVSLGTPYLGAANAIENIVLGNQMMQIAEKINRNNVTAQLMLNLPSLYQLLPAPLGVLGSGRDYPANWDLYSAGEWRWQGLRQDYLDAACAFHQAMAAGASPVEIVQIAGCNLDTTTDVTRSFSADERPVFRPVRHSEGSDSGDGTVPLWSASLPGARMYYVEERHRYLPGNKDVLDAVLELVHDGEPELPQQVPPKQSFWHRGPAIVINTDAAAADLRSRLEAGDATEEDLAQLYFLF